MKNIIKLSVVLIITLNISLVLHGLLVHKLSPIETYTCVAEEVSKSINTDQSLLITKCTQIQGATL